MILVESEVDVSLKRLFRSAGARWLNPERRARCQCGAAVMERSRVLLEAVEDLTALEELGEGVLDCADGEAWLALLARRAG